MLAEETQFRNVAIYLAGGNLAEFAWAQESQMAKDFRKGWLAAGGTK